MDEQTYEESFEFVLFVPVKVFGTVVHLQVMCESRAHVTACVPIRTV